MVNNLSKNEIDIAIIGGGIAGLWILARLIKSGYQAILLEAEDLACRQTGASQGIIHGGTKYALTGKLTHSAQSIQKMPQRWKECLDGFGEIDLSAAKKLSDYQYLWSNNNLASKLTGFFASKVMSSRMQHLSAKDYLPPFDHTGFKGELYQLDEPVLDMKSVTDTILQQFGQFIYQAEVVNISNNQGVNVISVNIINDSVINEHALSNEKTTSIMAKNIILTAGAGNEYLLSKLAIKHPKMQRRPLHMPMLKANSAVLPKMYAHCLGASALPKMTISSHILKTDSADKVQAQAIAKETMVNQEIVWYLGGEIAEKGINRSAHEQIRVAKLELQKLMPWMDFSSCQWSSLLIDRAEPKMPDASRPSEPSVYQTGKIITAWPVKLTMVPIMVDKIMQQLQLADIQKNTQRVYLKDLKPAKTTQLPWEKIKLWL